MPHAESPSPAGPCDSVTRLTNVSPSRQARHCGHGRAHTISEARSTARSPETIQVPGCVSALGTALLLGRAPVASRGTVCCVWPGNTGDGHPNTGRRGAQSRAAGTHTVGVTNLGLLQQLRRDT